jgi:hypothetical protein
MKVGGRVLTNSIFRKKEIEAIDTPKVLKGLLSRVLRVDNLEEFQEILKGLSEK